MPNPYWCLNRLQKTYIRQRVRYGKDRIKTTPKPCSNSRRTLGITVETGIEAETISARYVLTKAKTTDEAMASPRRAVSKKSISEKQARRVGSELAVNAVCHVPVIVPGLDRALTVLYRPVAARRVHPRPPHLAQAPRRERVQGRHLAALSIGRRSRHGL